MTRFEVDASVVAQTCAAARQSGAVISAEVTAMLRHLAALDATWRGSAATSFADLVGQWKATQHQVEASLDQILVALDAAARQYADVESATTRMFAS